MIRYVKLLLTSLVFTVAQDTLTFVILDSAEIDVNNKDTIVKVVFPTADIPVSTVFMTYELGCMPGGCDPWDRIAAVYAIKGGDTVEIARVITPYNKACSWTFDITPYRAILRDSVEILAYIRTWVGNGRGYYLSIQITMIVDSTAGMYPVELIKLWQNYGWGPRWEYGNPNNPIDSHLQAIAVHYPQWATRASLLLRITGHGQGNTNNAAEFYDNWHYLKVEAEGSTVVDSFRIWRGDCNQNPCSPQAGTWQYPRAGWCPGDWVRTHIFWLDSFWTHTPDSFLVSYYPQKDYVNRCRPDNPSCDPARDCMPWVNTCNYDGGGHTMPWYLIAGHLVFWSNTPNVEVTKAVSNAEVSNIRLVHTGAGSLLLVGAKPGYIVEITGIDGRLIARRVVTSAQEVIGLPHVSGVFMLYVYSAEGKFVMRKLIEVW